MDIHESDTDSMCIWVGKDENEGEKYEAVREGVGFQRS